MIGLTRSAALEYAPRGIRINAVCPGTIETPMVRDMIDKGELDVPEAVKNQPIGRRETWASGAESWRGGPRVAVQPAGGMPAGLDARQLEERAIARRAVEAVIWGMPAVNYRVMFEAAVRDAKGEFNQLVYWPGLLDGKNQTLTPNPNVIYLMPFINTKDVGPVVLEISPADEGAINGSVMNYWQAAIEDVGPAGVDKGKGGRYLILRPATRTRSLTGTSPCRRTPTRALPCCGRSRGR